MRKKATPLLAALALLLTLEACAMPKNPELPVPEPQTETTQAPEEAAETEPAELPPETTAPETTETEPQEERFLLTFAGDCTFGTQVENYYAGLCFPKTVGEDYGYPFRNVRDIFAKDDLTIVNLEGPLCEDGPHKSSGHVFHGPTAYTEILTQGSVEAVTIANNHTMDYGKAGYESTKNALDEAGIPFVERDSTRLISTESGLKIGLYGMVYYLLDVEKMTEGIQELQNQGADLIIVMPHWGVEKTYFPTKEQMDVGHAAIDAGADLVVGSHPHCLQPMEPYGNGLIFYSLGNFSFGGHTNPEDYDTVIIQQEIIRDLDGNVRLGETTMIPTCVSSIEGRNNYQPTPYEAGSEGYERCLQKLRWEIP